MHSVSLPGDDKTTVASILADALPTLKAAAEKETDSGLVQRLDGDTSGVLLGAKHRAAWEKLRAQLLAREIEKSYIALVEGKAPPLTEIRNYIGSPNRGAAKMRVYEQKPAKKERALPAHSIFQLLCYLQDQDCSLVRVSAPTARRHQVRAHAACIGHALVGDARYGSTRNLATILLLDPECTPQFLLHAERLAFTDPENGEKLDVSAPPSTALQRCYSVGKMSDGATVSSTSEIKD